MILEVGVRMVHTPGDVRRSRFRLLPVELSLLGRVGTRWGITLAGCTKGAIMRAH
jgi:hypothetical protein